ncbi:hypothetical protein ONZ51_g8707 [Trametes cubensis]|uniref:SHSP domain-containing protein n=1 Tax=Trametes cubensis TaxID=1111947 RepID=A0AAD7TMR1_9APHY|nr:hypothetical protein ONZ51_g8707 [Trametes cubensis]
MSSTASSTRPSPATSAANDRPARGQEEEPRHNDVRVARLEEGGREHRRAQQTVSGKSKQSDGHNDHGFVVRVKERYVKLSRSIPPEEIKVNLENGVLTAPFPRTTPEPWTSLWLRVPLQLSLYHYIYVLRLVCIPGPGGDRDGRYCVQVLSEVDYTEAELGPPEAATEGTSAQFLPSYPCLERDQPGRGGDKDKLFATFFSPPTRASLTHITLELGRTAQRAMRARSHAGEEATGGARRAPCIRIAARTAQSSSPRYLDSPRLNSSPYDHERESRPHATVEH